ncbi:MAG: diaminopimelate decarboxylase [Candidatus Dormibacteraeota bacterium]|uniref:Diaminopimelate decarboxylase n=1 Tax=Candidatus Dormiibacter inghamiae TaxID=3127013 RepID=A0A934KFD9_9BACT|nr:diaminopimelate decarboxylase [Candidatus Dormibacteraeota bacterium]MBJ7605685.1 diaminopimelate decarboxylase [Candidatus Dormibacteraeota bacterium]
MLLPVSHRVNERGHLEIGGCDLIELARRHGTPLYVYDEATVRSRCQEFMAAMGKRGEVLYSAKAFASPGFLRIVASEGLGLEVVSAGELHIALRAGYPTARIYFLGNNKSEEDVAAAFAAGATLVLDGFHDFELLRRVVPAGHRQRCLLRVSPGVDAQTHAFIATGQLDSKFGFSIESGAARAAVEEALAQDSIHLEGLHSHIGSQIFDLRGHVQALEIMLDLLAQLRAEQGYEPHKLGAGGGLGIAYTDADDPPTPSQFVGTLLAALERGAALRSLRQPALVVEPGRAIAGPAGVALYTVGSIKDIPGVRRYVAVDGGMGDNIRPKLYGARYQPLLAGDPEGSPTETVTIAGKYCESTDILVSDAQLPEVREGDILAMPAVGAYCLSLASQYNGLPRPAVVMVADGRDRLIRRRETYDDLLAAEIL